MTDREKVFKPFSELPQPLFSEYKKQLLKGIDVVIGNIFQQPRNSNEAEQVRRKMIVHLESIQEKWSGEERPHFIGVSLRQVLDQFDVPARIKTPLLLAIGQLEPDLNLTYKKANPKDLEDIASEGRGVYFHEEVGGKDCFLYVKGVGTKEILGQNPDDAIFPAYPQTPRDLFFDDTFDIMNGHPRIIGTETLLWGTHEHINSAILFAQAIKFLKINSFEEALDANIPIPVGLKEHPDLSLHVQHLLAQRYSQSVSEVEKRNLEWLGNWQPFVTVGTIVPGNKRMERVSDLSKLAKEEMEKSGKVMVDKGRAKMLGSCTNKLIRMGIVFSNPSSHGQNIYDSPGSQLPVADYSDLMFIGSLGNKDVELFSNTGVTHLTRQERQIFVICNSISRSDGQRPLSADFGQVGVKYSEALEANKVYWTELLAHCNFKASPTDLAKMSMFLPQYFEHAVSNIILDGVPDATKVEWQKVAEKQEQMFNQFDDTGTLLDTLNGRIEANAHNMSVYFSRKIQESSRTEAMRRFVENGNLKILESQPFFTESVRLMKAIDNISDPEIKSKLASTFSGLQSRRDFASIEEYIDKPRFQRDIAYLFEDKHFQRANELIGQGEFEAAEKLLSTVDSFSIMYVDESDFHPGDDRTNIKMWYAEKLLHCQPSEIPELNEQVEYFRLLDRSYKSACGSLMFNAFGNDRVDIFKEVKSLGLSHPRDVIVGLMGMMYKDKRLRDYVKGFYEQLDLILDKERKDGTKVDQIGLIAELDDVAEEYGSSVPMIGVVHHMTVLQYLRRTNPEMAIGRMNMALASIKEVDSTGFSSRLGFDNIKAKREMSDWRTVKAERGKMYNEMGYNRLGQYYEDCAKKEW